MKPRDRARVLAWGIALLTPLVASCARHGGVVVDLTSSDGKYPVIVQGNVTRPTSMFIEHVVSARVESAMVKSSAPSSWRALIRWTTRSARISNPDSGRSPAWSKFKTAKHVGSSAFAILTVENRSKVAVKCLSVKAQDLFVLMDLAAGETVHVPASPYTPGEVLTLVAKRCDAGRSPVFTIENFRNPEPSGFWLGRYVIRVEEEDRLTVGLDPPQPSLKH